MVFFQFCSFRALSGIVCFFLMNESNGSGVLETRAENNLLVVSGTTSDMLQWFLKLPWLCLCWGI